MEVKTNPKNIFQTLSVSKETQMLQITMLELFVLCMSLSLIFYFLCPCRSSEVARKEEHYLPGSLQWSKDMTQLR